MKKSNNNSSIQDSNVFAIMSLLLAFGLLYIEYWNDFTYIFILSFSNSSFLSIIYLILGFASIAFWIMTLSFILLTRRNRFDLNFNFLKPNKAGKLRRAVNFKLYKAENYFYLATCSLIICFVLTIKLKPLDYEILKELLISSF